MDERSVHDGTLVSSLLLWLNSPTYREELQYVEIHPELCSPQAETILEQLLVRYHGQDEAQMIYEHLLMLRDMQTRIAQSNYQQAIRETYINWGGGFLLDLPVWLEEVLQQERQLHQQGRPDQTALARTTLWRDAHRQALQEQVTLEIIAEILVKCSASLQDIRGIHKPDAVDECIAYQEIALQTYTQERYPTQWAKVQHHLGNAFSTRNYGERAENLEHAIQAFEASLAVYTPVTSPEEWATTQYSLATAYAQRIRGNRRENIEKAIAACEAAFTIRTREAFPFDWAITQNNLAIAYRYRIAGSRGENLDRAIVASEAALTVLTLETSPLEWAIIQNNLGAVYTERINGDRGENLEHAIAAYEAAITVYTHDAFPVEWATTQNNLAWTFIERIYGDRAENLERARIASEAALMILTPERYPIPWSSAQNNLAYAYTDRIRGERAENVEHAIKAYEAMLTVRTRETFPIEWARTQNNLASAYLLRIHGNRAENVELALTGFNAALLVRTPDAFPIEWATIQNNLSITYRLRMRGQRAANLEQALMTAEAALTVRTREALPIEWATTQNNLGAIYSARIQGDKGENVDCAIAAYEAALTVRTREAFPIEWAEIQNNLASAYGARMVGDKTEHLEQAVAAYEAALSVRTREDFPLDHRDTSLNLAWLASQDLAAHARAKMDASQYQAALVLAHRAYAQARLAQQDLAWIATTAHGKALARGDKFPVQQMYTRDAWVLWSMGRTREAVMVLEEGRAQALAESIATAGADLHELCEEHAHEFAAARVTLQEAITRNAPAIVRVARDNFLQIRTAIQRHCQPHFLEGSLDYAHLAEAATDRSLVYLSATEHGCLVLAISPDGGEPQALLLPEITGSRINDWLTRPDDKRTIVGGYLFALQHRTPELLERWLMYETYESEKVHQLLAVPFSELPAVIDPIFVSLRAAAINLLAAWRADERSLAEQPGELQLERLQSVQARLNMSLEELLQHAEYRQIFLQELAWFVTHQEVSLTLEQMGTLLIQPLRAWLDDQGWYGEERRIALIPCGELSILPLNAAWVKNPATGERVPFQETCELTYQASGQSLRDACIRGAKLPSAGPLLVVADPQPTKQVKLEWAEVEGVTLGALAYKSGRLACDPLIGEDALLGKVKRTIEQVGRDHPGALAFLATHGHADSHDPNDTYLLLANDQRLTLAELQRGRLLEGYREINAEGCVTGVGDLERAPDEILSFAGGLLQAGAAAALATQWHVSDRTTFLVMLQRMRLMLGDPLLSPARALRRAIHWLRTATWEDLDELARENPYRLQPLYADNRHMPDHLRGILPSFQGTLGVEREQESFQETLRSPATDLYAKLAHPARFQVVRDSDQPYPFAHPFYWGAFVVYGW